MRSAAALGSLLLLLPALVGCSSCTRREGPTPPEKARAIPRFDVHTHIHPRELRHAMQILGRNGVVGSVNLSGGQGRSLTAHLAAAKEFGGRSLVFTNLSTENFLGEGFVEHELAALEDARERGARGLKIYKALGLGFTDPEGRRVKVDDPRLDPIFEACGRLGFPVAIHTGDPKAFFTPLTPENERWDELSVHPQWSFHGNGNPTWEELFGEYERRVARHPKTTFIGVHFGNDPEEPARVGAMLDRYPNLLIDTAARVPEIGRMDPAQLRKIFVDHRTRILFGTDFALYGGEMMLGSSGSEVPSEADADRFFSSHWRFFETADRKMAHPTPIQGKWTVDGIALPEEVLEDVYHRNAERLFGLPPLTLP